MTLADPGLALEKAWEFADAVEASWAAYTHRQWDEDEQAVASIRGLLPLMRDIAERVHPEIVPNLREPDYTEVGTDEDGNPAWPWGTVNAAAQTLVGVLQNSLASDRILGPAGPALAASGLHEWVWGEAKGRWDDGYYGDAVRAAAEVVGHKTQVKLQRRDISGAYLYREAFSLDDPAPGRPRLRLEFVDEEDEETWKSAHEGAMHLGLACSKGMRNLVAHKKADLSEQEALEQLGALSVLARWVEASTRCAADGEEAES
ncbi:MAG: hypothetical protein OXG34_03145 [bacterium]|nr:hypothetical protein [bacterium]MCY4133757.1 hypothetical protein [bacterium]